MTSIKKVYFCFCLVFFSSYTLADTIDLERKFTIYAKLPLVPKILIMDIITSLKIGNYEYEYEFNINSKDIVVGIAASGSTTYVSSALEKCQKENISTGCIPLILKNIK